MSSVRVQWILGWAEGGSEDLEINVCLLLTYKEKARPAEAWKVVVVPQGWWSQGAYKTSSC